MINVSGFLILMSIAGIFICYKDYKDGLIKNEYIVSLLIFGILIQIINRTLFNATIQLLTVFVTGAFFSFLLWFVGILPAGDSKLLTTLFLYFPSGYYNNRLILNLLINVFVPIFFFVMFYIIYKSNYKELKDTLVKAFSPYRLLMIFLILTGFSWFLVQPFYMIGLNIGYLGSIILLFVGFEILLKTTSSKPEIVFVLLAIVRFIIDYSNVFSTGFVFYSILIVFIFAFFRLFVLQLSYNFYSYSVDINDLKKGMEPSEGIMKLDNGKYKKVDLFNASLIGYLRDSKDKFLHSLRYLKSEDVESIQKLKEEDKLNFNTLGVFRTQHFSTFLFIGYFITLIFGGNIVGLITYIV